MSGVLLTDPATELASLCEKLSAQGSPNSGFHVLAMASGTHPDQTKLFEALSIINRRIDRLLDYFHRSDDNFLTERVKSKCIDTLNSVRLAFNAGHLHHPWDHLRASYLNDDHIFVLQSISSRVRETLPLRRYTEDEREQLVEAITEILQGDFSGIPSWAYGALVEGLERILFTLEHLDFFGHEAVVDQLFDIKNRAEALASHIEQDCAVNSSPHPSLFKIVEVALMGIHLFVAPHHVGEAWHHYQAWLAPPAKKELKLISGPASQALLPPSQPQVRRLPGKKSAAAED